MREQLLPERVRVEQVQLSAAPTERVRPELGVP